MEKENLFFPEFPTNSAGLERGSVILANQDIDYLGIKKGVEFSIGFDGEFVRCSGLTWDIEGLVEEINDGVWTITGKKVNLDDPEIAKKFIKVIERR